MKKNLSKAFVCGLMIVTGILMIPVCAAASFRIEILEDSVDDNPEFILSLEGVVIGQDIVVDVFRNSQFIQSFVDKVNSDGLYTKQFKFNRKLEADSYDFSVKAGGVELGSQTSEIVAVVPENNHSGILRIKTDKTSYKVGDIMYVTISLTGLDGSQTGEALLKVEGLGITTQTQEVKIANGIASGIVSVVGTRSDCVKLDITAAWGSGRYHAAQSIPIKLTGDTVLAPPVNTVSEPTPSDPKPSEPKPSEPKPSEPKPSEPKPSEPKPSDPKPSDPKPSETKPQLPKTSDASTGFWWLVVIGGIALLLVLITFKYARRR